MSPSDEFKTGLRILLSLSGKEIEPLKIFRENRVRSEAFGRGVGRVGPGYCRPHLLSLLAALLAGQRAASLAYFGLCENFLTRLEASRQDEQGEVSVGPVRRLVRSPEPFFPISLG